jgi:hypothetical protein
MASNMEHLWHDSDWGKHREACSTATLTTTHPAGNELRPPWRNKCLLIVTSYYIKCGVSVLLENTPRPPITRHQPPSRQKQAFRLTSTIFSVLGFLTHPHNVKTCCVEHLTGTVAYLAFLEPGANHNGRL